MCSVRHLKPFAVLTNVYFSLSTLAQFSAASRNFLPLSLSLLLRLLLLRCCCSVDSNTCCACVRPPEKCPFLQLCVCVKLRPRVCVVVVLHTEVLSLFWSNTAARAVHFSAAATTCRILIGAARRIRKGASHVYTHTGTVYRQYKTHAESRECRAGCGGMPHTRSQKDRGTTNNNARFYTRTTPAT